MGMPVVTVAAGGLPVVDVTATLPKMGAPVSEALPGRGIAITKVANFGVPVTFDGAAAFATFDGVPSTGLMVMSNNNLTVTRTGTGVTGTVHSTKTYSSGKYYFELRNTVKSSGTGHALGVSLLTALDSDVANGLSTVNVVPANASFIYSNNIDQLKDLGTAASNDVYGFALDLTNRRAWIRRNAGNWNGDAAANPATNVNGVIVGAGSFSPVVYLSSALSDQVTANFGASAFTGAVPSGFTSGWPA